MTSTGTVIRCAACQTPNRVGAISRGTPQCAKCHAKLPWVVTADESSFTAETTSSVPVLVDFWAPSCGPCRMISPVVERLAARYAGKLKLVKVNVDENPGLAARFRAQSIPLLVLIEGGKEVDRQIGAVPEAQLQAWILPRIGASGS